MRKALTIGLAFLAVFSTFGLRPSIGTSQPAAYLTDFVQLTNDSYPSRMPSWSPDGSKIAYHAFSDSWFRHIWVMNADGSGRTQLTFGYVVDESPDYSPDGTEIVFMRWGLRGGIFDLMTMNADGTNIQQLTSTGLSHHRPKWSHDGQRVAFVYNDDYGNTVEEIRIMNADGSNQIALASVGPGICTAASWSPDDTRIVYISSDGIWMVNTSPPYENVRLFTTSLPATHICFSPDGKYILFTRVSTAGQCPEDFYLIDVNGNFVAQLTDNSMIQYLFDWSSDGQYIAFCTPPDPVPQQVWRARIVMALPPSAPRDFYLHGGASLDNNSPTAMTAKYKDSPGIKFSCGNPWKEIGIWTASASLTYGRLEGLSGLDVWLGLKNSDDQGTNFDLRAEVYKNSVLVASGETYLIKGVTRNPDKALKVTVSFGSFSHVDFDGTTDTLSLKILTRIGTDGHGNFGGGHSSAVGLRLYFDAVSRPAVLAVSIA